MMSYNDAVLKYMSSYGRFKERNKERRREEERDEIKICFSFL